MISSRMQKKLVAIAKRLVGRKFDKYEDRGICCNWLKINGSWGTKFTYEGFHYMNSVFKNQRRGWRLGFGPFCFGIFKVEIDDSIIYGYITQVATVANQIWPNIIWDLPSNVNKQIQKMKDQIKEKLGLYVNDMHTGNFGFLNGELVIIDWGFDA